MDACCFTRPSEKAFIPSSNTLVRGDSGGVEPGDCEGVPAALDEGDLTSVWISEMAHQRMITQQMYAANLQGAMNSLMAPWTSSKNFTVASMLSYFSEMLSRTREYAAATLV